MARELPEIADTIVDELREQRRTLKLIASENHLVLMDIRGYGLNGRQAEAALRSANLTLNRNVIPNDANGSWYTSGLRLGTPAMTSLGMGPTEMKEIATILHSVLAATKPASKKDGHPSLVHFETDQRVVAAARARRRLASPPSALSRCRARLTRSVRRWRTIGVTSRPRCDVPQSAPKTTAA